jgi:mono/diheme cytochrome c family protein
LAARCFECHGAEGEVKGSLSLASRDAALAGGDSGPAAVPGKPQESLLVEAIRYQGLKMPPKAKLPEPEIAKLVRWVELGR